MPPLTTLPPAAHEALGGTLDAIATMAGGITAGSVALGLSAQYLLGVWGWPPPDFLQAMGLGLVGSTLWMTGRAAIVELWYWWAYPQPATAARGE